LDEINELTIEQAKVTRSARFLREGIQFDINTIPNTDLVFRIMTWQHIPLLPPKATKLIKKSRMARSESINKFFDELQKEELDITDEDSVIEEVLAKESFDTNKADHIRIIFPPFFHYRLDENNNTFLVGKSHWKGSLESGEFCKTHGEMTEKLARMIMKLVEKYSMLSKFRNYSYREELQGQAVLQLCQVALQFNELKSANPFAFFTTISTNSFVRILNIEKKNQQLRDKLLLDNNMNPSFSKTNSDMSFEE